MQPKAPTLLLPPRCCNNKSVANPLVSIIVLCYNQSCFVLETLESVKAQIYEPTQLIIVDDCSSDGSAAIIERWLQQNRLHCTFIRHRTNQGICRSLNDALTATNGKYISMVSADDIWLSDKIERQVKIMEDQPETVGVLYSDAFLMDENGNALPSTFIAHTGRLNELPQGQILDKLLEGNFIPGMTSLIRRSCYDEVGMYDESLPWEDWDMWMRIAQRYSFIYSTAPSAIYRRHQNSLWHSNQGRMAKDSFNICLKHLRVGQLREDQKSILIRTMLHVSQDLYRRKDSELCDALLSLWRATGDSRAGCMYLFIKCGFSFRNWQRVNECRLGLRWLGSKLFNLTSTSLFMSI
jgi:glycosyltransferase involved in cell wall biosynthesis